MTHLADAELPVAAAGQLALVVADLVHVDPQRAEHLTPGVVLGAPVDQMSEAVSQSHKEISTSPYIQVSQSLREALKKTHFFCAKWHNRGGGGSGGSSGTKKTPFLKIKKVCLKCISSHSKSF